MGKATPKKTNSVLASTLVLVFLTLFPIIQVNGLYDGTYLPRFIYVQLGSLVILLVLTLQLYQEKKKWTLQVPILLYIGFWLMHWVSARNAINSVEATFGIIKTGSLLLWTMIITQGLISGAISIKQIFRGVTLFAAISALWAGGQILVTLTGGNFWEDIYEVYKPFGHKNLLSSALMLSLPFVLGHAASKDKQWSLVAKITLIVLLVEIFVLRTRAAWLGTLGGSLALLAVIFLKKVDIKLLTIKRIGLTTLAGIVLLIGVLSLSGTRESITNTGNLENRFWFWENSVEMMKENPMGVGPGNWRVWFPKYGLQQADNKVQNGITTINRPHNDYLWVGSEIGMLGLVFFLMLFLALFVAYHRTSKKIAVEDAPIFFPLVFGLVSYMLFSITDFPLERAAQQVLLGLLIALVCYYSQKTGSAIFSFDVPLLAVSLPAIVLLLWSLPFNFERLTSSKAYMDVYKANERRDPNRIIPAVKEATSNSFNVDFYGNPLSYFSGLGNNALQRYTDAENDFKAALELHPYHIISMNHLANTYKSTNRLPEAKALLTQALEIAPRYQQASLNLAEIQLKEADLLAAFQTLRQTSLYAPNPKYDGLVNDVLIRFINDGNLQQTQEAKIKALKKYGTNPQALRRAFDELRNSPIQ